MVLKLYADFISPYSQMILLVLLETQTPYELVRVEIMKGETKDPAFIAGKNPFGVIPCIDDDGFILFESAAIARYIAAKAGSPLLPTGDWQCVARFEQAMAIEKSQFESAIQPVTGERVGKPLRTGVPPDEARVATLVKTLETKLAAYEQMLAKQKYLAGDVLTLADLMHLPWGVYAAPQGFTWFDDEEKYPSLKRWWADISSRPAWKETLRLVHEVTPMYATLVKPRE